MVNNLENRATLQGLENPVLLHLPEYSPLDNFSPIPVLFNDVIYFTAEHAYQTAKFSGSDDEIARQIIATESATDVFELANANRSSKRPDWDEVKVGIMKEILKNKIAQHPEVQQKLMDTRERVIIEDSWPDDQWGIGEHGDGKNLLGIIWMELRTEFKILLFKS